jgi:hypothetical protein
MNFEACGRTESEKTQKFVLRTVLRPNQIQFSHGLYADSEPVHSISSSAMASRVPEEDKSSQRIPPVCQKPFAWFAS